MYYFKVRGQLGCRPGRWSKVTPVMVVGGWDQGKSLFYDKGDSKMGEVVLGGNVEILGDDRVQGEGESEGEEEKVREEMKGWPVWVWLCLIGGLSFAAGMMGVKRLKRSG